MAQECMLALQLPKPAWQSQHWAARERAAEMAGCMFPGRFSVTKLAGTILMESSVIKYHLVESKVLHSRMLSLTKTYFQMLKAKFWLFLGLNILTSYLKMVRYITWNEKEWSVKIWTKHFSSKCKLSEFCFISNWLLWVGVLFHAGTRYFCCCILKAESPSKWGLQLLYCSKH